MFAIHASSKTGLSEGLGEIDGCKATLSNDRSAEVTSSPELILRLLLDYDD